jgi:hypothetical protein
MTCRDVLYISFREARILKRPQGACSDSELQDGLIFLNQLIDYWAARECYAWTSLFAVYTLTAGHQPHLMGPGLSSPDFNVRQRPTSIRSCSIVIENNVDVPVTIRDSDWWASQSVKSIQSNIPTDLYYQPQYPYGELWFWPVPSTGYQIRLEDTVVLEQFQTMNDLFLAPQAYQAAITLTLAEELVDIWGTEMPLNLARRAMKARDALQSNNFLPPRISSADWGTSGCSAGGDFNYLTGGPPGR